MPETIITEKFCRRCQARKPASAFYRRRDAPIGLMAHCKECQRLARRPAPPPPAPSLPGEEWRPVAGYEGWYEVSNHGRVRGGLKSYQVTYQGRILRHTVSDYGYCTINLSRGGNKRLHFVHRLVAAAFIGPRPEGLEVNHRNGIKTDNRPANLEYLTPSANCIHAIETGLAPAREGEGNGQARLTESQVEEIRQLYASGVTQKALAQAFGVGKANVSMICGRKSWRHLP